MCFCLYRFLVFLLSDLNTDALLIFLSNFHKVVDQIYRFDLGWHNFVRNFHCSLDLLNIHSVGIVKVFFIELSTRGLAMRSRVVRSLRSTVRAQIGSFLRSIKKIQTCRAFFWIKLTLLEPISVISIFTFLTRI